MIFLEVKFGSVVNGIVDIAAGHGSVGYHCCSGDRCASEEPDDGNLTHIAERSSWDEQEDGPRQSYGKKRNIKDCIL